MLYPTPTAIDAGSGRVNRSLGQGAQDRPTLALLARKGLLNQWPTPQERDWRTGSTPDSPRMARKQEQGWSPNLNDVAGLWPTPTVNGNHNRQGASANSGDGLATSVRQWSTPAAQDAKNATLPVSQATRDTLPGDLLRQGSAGKLNPAWVSQLMGFPDGWLDIPAGPHVPAKRNTSGKRRAPFRQVTAHPDALRS